MRPGSMLAAAAVVAALVAPLPAQFGDLVGDYLDLSGDLRWNGVDYDAPGTGDAVRMSRVLQPGGWGNVGLADAAHDLVTASTSTMSSAYQTIMSATVNVDEQGDRVLIDVTAQLGRMGAGLFIADLDGLELWMVENPSMPTGTSASFPSGLDDPRGMTVIGGTLHVVDASGNMVFAFADPADLTASITRTLPSDLGNPRGAATDGTALYVADDGLVERLFRFADPTDLTAFTAEDFPAAVGSPRGMTMISGTLYVATATRLWTFTDLTDLSGGTNAGFPALLTSARGLTTDGSAIYVSHTGGTDRLWTCPDPADLSTCTSADMPSGLSNPRGMAPIGNAPCDIRISRGTTDVETITLDAGRIWLDATFVDRPSAGTYTYALQHKTSDPNTVCTAYRGDGSVPMPSMLVQVVYGS